MKGDSGLCQPAGTPLLVQISRRLGVTLIDVETDVVRPIHVSVERPIHVSVERPTHVSVILAAKCGLDADGPVHLFGAGHPMMLALAVAAGCDLFDSAAYALHAREG